MEESVDGLDGTGKRPVSQNDVAAASFPRSTDSSTNVIPMTAGENQGQNLLQPSLRSFDVTPSPGESSSREGGSETSSCSPAPSESSKDDGPSGSDDLSNTKKKSPKKRDRSKLRKGKWKVEEEEYTSKIIHYFSIGLLTLPEGATLRSYLADKLNCDPMRITKKYAGSSCLGRRTYEFRDRPPPSSLEIQFAKAELDLLEQRFRLRVEEGQSGMPLPLPTPNMMSIPPQQATSQSMNPLAASVNPTAALQTWILALAASGVGTLNPPPLAVLGLPQTAPAPPLNGLILPSAPSPAPAAQTVQPQMVLANLALAQLAGSLASTAPQPAPKPATTNPHTPTVVPPQNGNVAPCTVYAQQQLKDNFQQHLMAQNMNPAIVGESGRGVKRRADKGVSSRTPEGRKTPSRASGLPKATKPVTSQASLKRQRSDEEKADGTILMGFLNSLRQSYEDAIRAKDESDKTPNMVMEDDRESSLEEYDMKLSSKVTDSSSSNQPESSLEDYSDWNSDKKTDPSSSEADSDKDDKEGSHSYSIGPPRKRHKIRKDSDVRAVTN